VRLCLEVGLRLLLLCLVAALAPGVVGAQSLQNLILRNSFSASGAGARGTGMGGAFIAVADDGTASAFNPAGLAQLRRTELAIVGFGSELDSEVGTGAELERTEFRHGALEFAGLAVPLELGSRRLTLQLSYQRAVDLFGEGPLSVVVPFSEVDEAAPSGQLFANQFRLDLDAAQSGALHTVSLAAGYEVTDRLALGASANYWIGSWNAEGLELGYLEIGDPRLGPPGVYAVSREEFSNEQRLRGLNLNLGFLLSHSWISFGGVLRTPFAGSYDVEERGVSTDIFVSPEAQPWERYARTRLQWPRSAGLGLAVRPLRWLTLAVDHSYVEWSKTTLENLPNGALQTDVAVDAAGEPDPDYFVDRNFFDLFPAPVTTTQNALQWRVGAEALLTFPKLVVPLRMGAFWDRSPVSDLQAFEGRRINGFTFGTGLNFDRIVFDVTFERRTSEGALGVALTSLGPQVEIPETGAFPTEQVSENRIVASLILRLGGDDDPVRKATRGLLGVKAE
jgi:long-chain fatty acid transport protein